LGWRTSIRGNVLTTRFRAREHEMPWWLIILDVYVVCLAIVAWTISVAPVIPDLEVR
jgi:hypothetical protein